MHPIGFKNIIAEEFGEVSQPINTNSKSGISETVSHHLVLLSIITNKKKKNVRMQVEQLTYALCKIHFVGEIFRYIVVPTRLVYMKFIAYAYKNVCENA